MLGPAAAADPAWYGAPAIGVARAAAPVSTWTGLYVGVNAGADVGGHSGFQSASAATFREGYALLGRHGVATGTFAPEANVAAALAGGRSNNGVGFAGGAQAGVNYQVSPFVVLGVEADIQGFAGGSKGGGSLVSADRKSVV